MFESFLNEVEDYDDSNCWLDDCLGFNYVISGKLLCYGNDVSNKQVAIKVNGTAAASVNTSSSGCYTATLKLKPINNTATTYQLEAFFSGDNALNYTHNDTAPDGTEYPLCTTLYYYGYKPSANTTILTVDPKSTQLTTTTKTPEQLQAEAEQSGWLSFWHEFSWWYPWYRLHVKINVNPTIDIGLNPILPGGETYFWDGLEFFQGLTEEIITDIMLDIVGLFTAYFVARKFSFFNPAVGVLMEIAKFFVQLGLLVLSPEWANRGVKLLGSGIGSILMALLAIKVEIAEALVNALIRLCKWVASAMMRLFTVLMEILKVEQLISRWWIDVIEVAGDFALGVLAFARYLGRI